jgi:putative copper export protein
MTLKTAVDRFCLWLEQTDWSQTIQATPWIVPAVQTVHILAIAIVLGSVLMINLRLLGLVDLDQPIERVCSRFLPVIWWGLLVLLATGIVMITGEPARSLKNPVFLLKMGLVVAALGITAFHQLRLARRGEAFKLAPVERGTALLIAIPSLALWTAIVFAGRWIAYY